MLLCSLVVAGVAALFLQAVAVAVAAAAAAEEEAEEEEAAEEPPWLAIWLEKV